MSLLKGKTLRDAIISGANHIANNRQQVDALNVFPVPDGDTGTNMSMTISAARRELERLDDNVTVEEVSKTAASALLRGARGNSGVILSLLFRGFSKGLAGKKTATPADIANALSLGVEAAYKAVMKPTEGTILTVSRAAAERAREAVDGVGQDVALLWDELTAAAAEMLEKTPEMLPVLKKAGVVDAGGKGFLVIFEGMASVIKSGVIIPVSGAISPISQPEGKQPASFFEDDDGFSGEITFTYCTEFIVVRGENEKSPLLLRAFLETIGDCVVVVDDEEIIKVHVHTDHPGKAMEEAITYGMLTKLKVDNMRLQYADQVSNAKRAARAEAEQIGLPYCKPDPDRPFGFVAIAAGDGVRQLFLDLGVDQVVSGGQTMNPSTDDILSAVQAVGAQTVFVLPNNKNIIMAAEQTVNLADRQVIVLQTKTIPQGLSAMLAFDAEQNPDANFHAMSHAAGNVATGQITFAARDSDYDGHKIKEGEILALLEGKVAFVERDLIKAANKLAKSIINRDSTFVTILYGEGATEEQANQIAAYIHSKCGNDLEVAVVNGGQPVYYFILSAE